MISLPTDPDDPAIEIRRSTRRRKTVSARLEGDKVVVLMPAGRSRHQERQLISGLLGRMARSRGRSAMPEGDDALTRRAEQLSARHLDGRATPTSIRWVPEMTSRWASCTQETGAVRISESLRDVPAYVLDYVIVHELAHLLVPGGHPPEFWALVERYPRTERAIGYLEAYSRVLGRTPAEGDTC